jgi:hypothetical protein
MLRKPGTTGNQFYQITINKSQSFSLFVQLKLGSNSQQNNANNHTN